MLQEGQVHIGPVTLHYAEGPQGGDPLILLHGGSARWQAWEALLPDLVPHARVVALDLRGHGQSGWQTPYTLQSYTEDVLAYLTQRAGRPAILCGHSLGGMVALLAAARGGPAVRGVIVGDSPLDATTWLRVLTEARERIEEWYTLASAHRSVSALVAALKESPVEVPGQAAPLPAQLVFGDESPWFDWMARNLAPLDPATLEVLIHDAEEAAAGYRLDSMVPAIHCPIWLIQADPASGGMMPDSEVRRAQVLSPHVRHRQLAGVGHALHATHPAEVRDAIVAAVRDIQNQTV